MLVLDFINVGNGDSILVREMEGERLRFSMLVDCGHDSLERDDHPPVEDPRSCRIDLSGQTFRISEFFHQMKFLFIIFQNPVTPLHQVMDSLTADALFLRDRSMYH